MFKNDHVNIFVLATLLVVAVVWIEPSFAEDKEKPKKTETAITLNVTQPAPYKETVKLNSRGGKTYNIVFAQEIYAPENYSDLVIKLDMASKDDVFYFYVSGQGGYSMSALNLYNALKTTRADTYAIVNGPVYSAHAYIAVMTKHIFIQDGTLFMYHRASTYGGETNCGEYVGKTDRTRDMYKKCLDVYSSYKVAEDKFLPKLLSKYLTSEELQQVIDGYDVYIDGEEMRRRVGVKNANR